MTAVLVIAFLAVFGLILSAGLLLFRRDPEVARLAAVVGQRAGGDGFVARIVRGKESIPEIIKPFENIVPRTAAETSVIQKRLIRAGYRDPRAVNIFYSCKVLVPIALALLATVTGIYQSGPFFIYGCAIALGFLAPDFWLGNRIKARQRKIRRGLPEALDLMVICSEAGLGIDQTIFRVCQELKLSQPEIHDELSLVNLEQRAGKPRDESLKSLADRVNIDSVRALVNTLLQADTFGTSISKTLRVYSDTLRMQRKQAAEEQAAKTTVKLVFPLVFFIFPSIFVVALGPAMISMYEGFIKYLLT